MIPKIIHYCWFGEREKPENVVRMIEGWKKKLPDYTFMEWNDTNFNVNELRYTQSAYNQKKYAFVSDVARLKALSLYGGIYMDTDVEVIRSFDDILDHRCILGMEERNFIATSFIAAEPDFPLINDFIGSYSKLEFDSKSAETNVQKLTKIMVSKGFVQKNEMQQIGDITVFPREYFSPYDYINCIDMRTENTYCVHHFSVTWMPRSIKIKKALKKAVGKLLGKKRMDRLRGYYE